MLTPCPVDVESGTYFFSNDSYLLLGKTLMLFYGKKMKFFGIRFLKAYILVIQINRIRIIILFPEIPTDRKLFHFILYIGKY